MFQMKTLGDRFPLNSLDDDFIIHVYNVVKQSSSLMERYFPNRPIISLSEALQRRTKHKPSSLSLFAALRLSVSGLAQSALDHESVYASRVYNPDVQKYHDRYRLGLEQSISRSRFKVSRCEAVGKWAKEFTLDLSVVDTGIESIRILQGA